MAGAYTGAVEREEGKGNRVLFLVFAQFKVVDVKVERLRLISERERSSRRISG